ncbi:TetR/AcrR family transcriptional regulator [Flagellatimonas centrodinii]|uniref:TetR/AcrR family transcriptional regulator n=1 Tax=Flagellatimonas centrodinii TaxID=2806210 RepID=UPI001FEFC0E8|nr:TetR/AcrR family transcriptional regulator [Flagellatimonas centrodinii]ULQ47513.1 TetR/AcrR family transcriptional regulator [Flagellatimonas centrodinii]
MARTRAFDEDHALERALSAFWTNGYKATSLDQLLAATGLSKSSLYDTFGSKRQLLVSCLDRYDAMLREGILAPLLQPGASRPAIEAALRRCVHQAIQPEGVRGCFANNCLTELATVDAELQNAARAVRQRLEAALMQAVRHGQADGSIGTAESPRALARFLVNTVTGLNLAAKAQPGRAALEDIVRVALRVLD